MRNGSRNGNMPNDMQQAATALLVLALLSFHQHGTAYTLQQGNLSISITAQARMTPPPTLLAWLPKCQHCTFQTHRAHHGRPIAMRAPRSNC